MNQALAESMTEKNDKTLKNKTAKHATTAFNCKAIHCLPFLDDS